VRPYYEQDGITIYHGDCRDILPSLPLSDALVLTDPPYGIAHPTDYATRKQAWAGLAERRDYAPVHGDDEPFDPSHLLDIGAARILWGGNYFADKLPPVSGWLVWDKERPDDLDQATCELAWTDCVKGVRRFRHLWNGMIRASERDAALQHPTQKPVALMQWCLGLRWTAEYRTVCDPYMGAGATLVAARNMNRHAIGIEIAERYCEITATRLSQTVLDLGGAA
jgi:site-specific DNA-methyltransferase (adenine-specific)